MGILLVPDLKNKRIRMRRMSEWHELLLEMAEE
jgi:hypothetical protein